MKYVQIIFDKVQTFIVELVKRKKLECHGTIVEWISPIYDLQVADSMYIATNFCVHTTLLEAKFSYLRNCFVMEAEL